MKLQSRNFLTFVNLIDLIFSISHSIDVNWLAMVFWLIWNRRNLARQQASTIDLQSISPKAKALLHSAQTSSARPLPTTPKHTRWSPPYDPFYKINFDGAASIDVVIRNSLGSVISSLAQRFPLPTLMAMIEALACRRAIQFAMELSIFDAIFEGDSKVVVKALQARKTSSLEFSLILSDVLLLVYDFRNVLFSHIKRTCNLVAHYLAKCAKFGDELQV